MRDSSAGQMFSQPEHDRDVMSMWERLLCGDEGSSDALRRLIDDSWRRCLIARVNPRRDEAPPPLEEDSLYTLRQKHGDLLQASTPVMAHAREFLSETGTVMVLTDQSGTILNLEGDPATLLAAENMNMTPGGNWSEAASGTNAIGTALAVGHPVQIHSAEHYCAGIKRWTCSSTVILDPYDSSILGAIDVSGLQQTYNRHSLALVVAAASRIESRLVKKEMEIRFRLLERCMHRLTSSSAGDGVIVFDRRGNPVKANETAEAALKALDAGHFTGRKLELSSLSLGRIVNGVPTSLDPWIRPEWLDPIFDNGVRVGTVLTVPLPRRHGAIKDVLAARGDAVRTGASKLDQIIGNDPELLEAVERARQLAKSNVPVLLLGETGVGKEVFANGIHECGSQKGAPCVALNCGGLSRELLAAELFGYAEGSFTGARRGGMIGKIEAANGGTLFLDELGEMPLDLQPHLLRVLEESEIYRLGENTPRKVKFRLIAATNRDLRKDVTDGKFRMDLFYRVAVTSIRIPPLRNRAGDIQLLAEHFLGKLARQHGLDVPVLASSAVTCMASYEWPGNVRELKNVLEGMLLSFSDGVLTERALPPEVRAARGMASTSAVAASTAFVDSSQLEIAERGVILAAINAYNGNMTATARSLGISKSTLYARMRRFGLDAHVQELRTSRSGAHRLTEWMGRSGS